MEATPVQKSEPQAREKLKRTLKERVAVKAPAPTQELKLSLTKTDLDDLESREGNLFSILRIESQDEGWRVHIISEDPALSRIGLNDGDLITYESLKNQHNYPDCSLLACL